MPIIAYIYDGLVNKVRGLAATMMDFKLTILVEVLDVDCWKLIVHYTNPLIVMTRYLEVNYDSG